MVNHENRAHAKLSASGSERWLSCPASVQVEAKIPNKGSSSFALEGTVAHEVAEMCLSKDLTPDEFLGKEIQTVTVDESMVEHVQSYIDYVRSFEGELMVEVRVDFSHIVPEGFGTSDALIMNVKDKILHVIDLKYGQGVLVDAVGNSQGRLYGLGAINDLGFLYDIEEVHIHIFQPRRHNVSVWELGIDELNEWAEYVKQRAKLAFQPEAPFGPSEKACQFCRAKHQCKALADHTAEIITAEFDDMTPTCGPSDLTDEQIAKVLENKGLIANWLNAVEQYVTEKLESGESVPGFKLVASRTQRKLKPEAEEILKEKHPDLELYSQKLKGLGELEKIIGKKNFADLDLTFKPEGRPVLAPESDRRKAIVAVADLFED